MDGIDSETGAAATEQPAERPPGSIAESRFLFVDVAAQRAKQLRRGTLPRLPQASPSQHPLKLERVAMEEVRQGFITYELPPLKPSGRGGRT